MGKPVHVYVGHWTFRDSRSLGALTPMEQRIAVGLQVDARVAAAQNVCRSPHTQIDIKGRREALVPHNHPSHTVPFRVLRKSIRCENNKSYKLAHVSDYLLYPKKVERAALQ